MFSTTLLLSESTLTGLTPKKQDSLNRELNFIEPLFVLIIEVRDEILRTREVALR